MSVWIVIGGFDYESDTILRVCATAKSARAALEEEKRNRKDCPYDSYFVGKYEVEP